MFYWIRQGNHYSFHWPQFHFWKKKQKIRFVFGVGSWFKKEHRDDYAINKLAGLSYGHHHTNSIRCGWVPSKETQKIDLHFYVYNKGERSVNFFWTVDMSTEYELTIKVMKDDTVWFTLHREGVPDIIDTAPFVAPLFKAGYTLFPYIGGNRPARTDTGIYLKFL